MSVSLLEYNPAVNMKTIKNLYARIGTRSDVDAKIANAQQLASSLEENGWGKLEIKDDADAQTVEISVNDNGDETPLMKAMHKGEGVWLCMYNPEFYPKSPV